MRGTQKQQPILLPTFQFPHPFWSYQNFETKELELYLQQQLQNISTAIPKSSIQEGYHHMCKLLNYPPHPLINIKQQKIQAQPAGLLGEQSIDSIKNTSEICSFFVLQNTQIDTITLTLLRYLWPLYPTLNVLKIYNTKFSDQEIDIISKIIDENKLIKLFIEYSNKVPKINSQSIVQLYLRGNSLTPEILADIFKQGNLPQLQVIELSDNSINREGIQVLGTFMSKKNSIQYIGLSRCEIPAWEELKPLIEVIGPEKLNEAKLQAYRELEEKRDKQIKDQLKAKKKEVVTEIELEALVSNSDGTFSIIHNQQMQLLYLAINSFKDTDKDQLERFLAMNPAIFVVLQGSSFETKTKERLKKKYSNVVF